MYKFRKLKVKNSMINAFQNHDKEQENLSF